MDESETPTATDQARLIETDQPTTDDLLKLIAAKREEFGIVDLEPRPVAKFLPPLPPALTAEEIAVREHAEARRALTAERARRDGVSAMLLGQAGTDFDDCTLDTFEASRPAQQRVLAMVREYAETLPERFALGEGMVLYGPVGTGKDHLAFAVCLTAIQRFGRSVFWIYGPDWFGKIRDAMDDTGDRYEQQQRQERRIISQLVEPDFLVISDPLPPFGGLGEHMAGMLCRVIHNRGKACKPTIITINIADDAEAIRRLGAPTWDRMRERAWMAFCYWPSHRKPARELKCK